jgi:hypothetical protein
MVPPNTTWYRLKDMAHNGPLENHIRNHISDSLILFPKDKLFLSFSYIARPLSLAPYVESFKPFWLVYTPLVSLYTSGLKHLFTCLLATHWSSCKDPMCSLIKLALQQLLSIPALALPGLPGNKL